MPRASAHQPAKHHRNAATMDLELVRKLFDATLGRNRDEFEVLARRMGWRPMQAARARKRPISPQPEGQCAFRAVCGVAALAHSGAMGCAPRLASHPEKSAARHQIIYGQVLGVGWVCPSLRAAADREPESAVYR